MRIPTYRKELHPFIGVVNYYRYMWARFLHTLAPLTNITSSNVKLIWTKTEHDAFEEIRRIVDRDNLLAYTDFNE